MLSVPGYRTGNMHNNHLEKKNIFDVRSPLNVKCDCLHCTYIKTVINGINSLKEKLWYYKRVNPSTVNSSDQRICL
jgi:hypothetical protein